MAHSDLSRFSIAVDPEPNLLANGVAAKGGLKFPWGAHRVVIDGDDAIPLLHAFGRELTSGPRRGPKRDAALVRLSEAGPAPRHIDVMQACPDAAAGSEPAHRTDALADQPFFAKLPADDLR